jgi:hypothetical protein
MSDENIRTFKDLYFFLRNYEQDSIIGWLDNDNWKGKEKQESLLRLFGGFGLIEKIKNYDICKGNFNLKEIQIMTSKRDIFYKERNKKIYLNDSGDASDLTGILKENDNHLLVTTSKNLNKTNIGKLSISDIILNFEGYKKAGFTMTLCVCTQNKEEFELMLNNTKKTSHNLLEYAKNAIVIDWNDLDQAYKAFKRIKMDFKEITKTVKPILNLKPHQRLGVVKTLKLKEKDVEKVLWGHIQRSGKSYIMAGCVIEDSKGKEKCNYLVITTAPSETIDQYFKVFNCAQLQDFNVIYLNGKNNKPKIENKNIIVCSKQFLQTKLEKTKSIKWLKELEFEMRFIDESHNGGTTLLAQNTLKHYGDKSFTVQITATYSKPIRDYNIPYENWILWDLEDINLCKTYDEKSISKLVEKHGEELKKIFSLYTPSNIKREYSKYPYLHLLTHKLKPEVVEDLVYKTRNNDHGWSTESAFLLHKVKKTVTKDGVKIEKYISKSEFQNEDEVVKIFESIFKKSKYGGFGKGSFMERIEKICKNPEIKSRFEGSEDDPTIIMIFLPQNNIEMKSEATEKVLIKHNIVPEYEILSINSSKTKDPKKEIENARIRAKNNHKKGVIVLSGRQCSLGVSIHNCNIVILLNNNNSFDMVYQMMFRCMTEGKGKKCGFVIDLNIQRVINTTITEYATLIHPKLHPQEAIQLVLYERLVNLNADHWMESFGNSSECIETMSKNIYKIYSSNTEHALNQILNRLYFKNVKLTDEEQKTLKLFYKGSKKPSINHTEPPKETVKKGAKSIEKLVPKTPKKEEEINYMDIFKHIVPLICLITINNEESDFLEMYKLIKENEYLYNILFDQIKTWWGKNTTFELISKIIDILYKYMEINKEIEQNMRTIKELFAMNTGNTRKLSNLIDKYLIPQELEKKNNAEISTPFKLRQEMLDKTPKSFWKRERKVFEPCSGKGGFLIDIVDRFMDGLKEKYPDEGERYKIIIEECLYFCDINPTNIFINKLLLDPKERYKLNFHEGNTLELDIKEKWGLKGFDLVIGNPPYNSSGNTGTGNTIWQLFTKKALNEWLNKRGYLLFVHPPGWRKPNTERGKFYGLFELMTKENQMLYLSIHGIKDGKQTFKCGTRYDWYIIKKTPKYRNTIVKDENGENNNINMGTWDWLPNSNMDIIKNLLVKNKEEKCNVICDFSYSRLDKKNVSKYKTEIYNHELIYLTPKKGVRYMYSKTNDKGHFNKAKVIIGETGMENAINDYKGNYGMTQDSFGILIQNKSEGENILKCVKSPLFNEIIRKSCSWSNFRIDWRLFTYFRKDFWKEFIDE